MSLSSLVLRQVTLDTRWQNVLGGFAAVGPVLQGLNKPVNDLSRGCNADDVYKLTLITAAQAVEQ